MNKVYAIIQTAWQRQLAYRFTMAAYRIGEILEVLFLIVMWSALYENRPIISGYTLPEMLTYVLIGNLVSIVTRNFIISIVTRDIHEGGLSLFLVKPITYLRYAFIRELGRVTLPTALSVTTHLLVIACFSNRILFNTDARVLTIFLLMVILAFFQELMLSFIVALVCFWTHEVDGLYSAIDRLKRFISGSYFPLTLLPPLYVKVSLLFPFAYAFFVPTQLFLNKMTVAEGLYGLGVQIVWLALLYGLIQLVWYKGIRKYEGVGI